MESDDARRRVPDTGGREQRRADLALVRSYHEEQLRRLVDRLLREVNRYERRELDVFELDDVIHHYKRAARELWKFCGDHSGSAVASTARALRTMQAEASGVDWWDRGGPRR